MASIRLAEWVKKAIVENAKKETFATRQADLKSEKSELGKKVYKDITDKFINTMCFLPEGFFPRARTLSVNFGLTSWDCLVFNFPDKITVPYGYYTKGIELTQLSDETVSEIKKYNKKLLKLRKDKNDLAKKVNEVLSSCTTTGKLLKIWPEVEKYLPDETKETPNLPAVVPENVNRMIAEFKEG